MDQQLPLQDPVQLLPQDEQPEQPVQPPEQVPLHPEQVPVHVAEHPVQEPVHVPVHPEQPVTQDPVACCPSMFLCSPNMFPNMLCCIRCILQCNLHRRIPCSSGSLTTIPVHVAVHALEHPLQFELLELLLEELPPDEELPGALLAELTGGLLPEELAGGALDEPPPPPPGEFEHPIRERPIRENVGTRMLPAFNRNSRRSRVLFSGSFFILSPLP